MPRDPRSTYMSAGKTRLAVSSRRLWLLSVRLYRGGRPRLARWVYFLNSLLYSNSLPFEADVSPDVRLGHHAFGTVIHPNVVIGRRVKIFHNVTMVVRSAHNPPKSIVLEDDVRIGAHAVLITSRSQGLRIGRGARIGAGVVVTHDVPAGATVVSARPRVLMPDGEEELAS